jgi:hypothetical protein
MPEEKSRQVFPSTSVSVHPWPLSKTTGHSVTWLEYPFMILAALWCIERDLGPGTSVTICGNRVKSTSAHPMSGD